MFLFLFYFVVFRCSIRWRQNILISLENIGKPNIHEQRDFPGFPRNSTNSRIEARPNSSPWLEKFWMAVVSPIQKGPQLSRCGHDHGNLRSKCLQAPSIAGQGRNLLQKFQAQFRFRSDEPRPIKQIIHELTDELNRILYLHELNLV